MLTNCKEVRIENATICNHNCVFCPMHTELFERKGEIMSLENFQRIIDEIVETTDIREVSISGMGESFLDPSIMEKYEYVKEKGFKAYVLTNGTMSKLQFRLLYDMGIENFRVSLHSLDEYEFRKITRSNRLSEIVDLIEYMIEVDSSKVIIYGVRKLYEESIIHKYYGRVGAIELWKPHNWVNTFCNRIGPAVRKTCGRPFNGPLQIQVDQTVNMCCFDYNGKILLGDLKLTSLKHIFENKPYRELASAHKSGVLDKYICNDCDQRKSKKGIIIYSNFYPEEKRLNLTSTGYNDFRCKRDT